MTSTPRALGRVERREATGRPGRPRRGRRSRKTRPVVAAERRARRPRARARAPSAERCSRGAASVATTRAPRASRGSAAATPLCAEPDHDDASCPTASHRAHLSFSDARLTSARRIEMIQKRTMILGSAHPFFS